MSRADPLRRAWVRQLMGMPVSIHIRGPAVDEAATADVIEAVFAELAHVDAVFSPFRADSQISQLHAGTLTLAACDPDVREVLELCEDARERTDGAFDASVVRSDGSTGIDPTGLVKGWAVERAALHLSRLAGHDHYLNAGGDIAVGTDHHHDEPQPWRIGVEDPTDTSRVLAVVPLLDGGIATSGSTHRGLHILDPRTGQPATGLRSATVIGASLMWADVYATAAVVRGIDGAAWVHAVSGYDAITVDAHGLVQATGDLRSFLTATST